MNHYSSSKHNVDSVSNHSYNLNENHTNDSTKLHNNFQLLNSKTVKSLSYTCNQKTRDFRSDSYRPTIINNLVHKSDVANSGIMHVIPAGQAEGICDVESQDTAATVPIHGSPAVEQFFDPGPHVQYIDEQDSEELRPTTEVGYSPPGTLPFIDEDYINEDTWNLPNPSWPETNYCSGLTEDPEFRSVEDFDVINRTNYLL